MSQWDDDDDRMSGGWNSHGRGSSYGNSYGGSSYGAGLSRSHDPSKFDSASLVGKDGKFFGIQMDPQMADVANTLAQQVILPLRRKLEEKGGPIARRFAQDTLKMTNLADVHRFENRATTAIGLSTIFAPQLIDTFSNVRDTVSSLNDMRAAGMILDNGSLARTMRKKVSDVFKARMAQVVASSVAALPQLYFWHEDGARQRAERQQQQAYEQAEAKGTKALVEYFEKELGGGALNISKEMKRGDVLSTLVKHQEEKYLADFKAFEAANKDAIKKKLLEEIGDFNKLAKGTQELDPVQYKARQKYHLDGYFREQWDGDGANRARNGNFQFKAGANSRQNDLKKRHDQQVDDVVKQLVQGKFVREHGALNDEWERHRYTGLDEWARHSGSRENHKTMRNELVERFTKRWDDSMGIGQKEDARATQHEKEADRRWMEHGGVLGGTLFANMLTKMLGTKKLEEVKRRITAPELIMHMDRTLAEAAKRDGGVLPEEIAPIQIDGKSEGKPMGYAEYTFSILNRSEIEKGRPALDAKRYCPHFVKAGWNDERIHDIPRDELTPLEAGVRAIAFGIKRGELPVLGTFKNVIDNPKFMLVRGGGRFGPAPSGSDTPRQVEDVEKMIDTLAARARGKKQMNGQQVSEQLGGLVVTPEEIRAIMQTWPGEQRDFFYALLEAKIPDRKELCKITGLSEEQCENASKSVGERFSALVDAAFFELNEMMKDKKEAAKLKFLTPEEKKLLKTLVSQAEEQGTDIPDVLESAEQRTAAHTLAANAMAALDYKEKGKDGFWKRVLDRVTKRADQRAEAAKEAAERKELEESGDDKRSSRYASADYGDDDGRPAKKWASGEKKSRSYGDDDDDRGFSPDRFRSFKGEDEEWGASVRKPKGMDRHFALE